MRSFLTLVFLFSSITLWAQSGVVNNTASTADTTKAEQRYKIRNGDTINRIDEQGLRQGFWTIYGASYPEQGYRPMQIVETGEFVDSQRSGKWQRYWGNGNMAYRIHYENGKPHGKYTLFYESGKIEEDGQWINGHPHKMLRRYHENGVILELENYDSLGNKVGQYLRFNAQGNLILRKHVALDEAMQNGNDAEVAERLYHAGELKERYFGSILDELPYNGRAYHFKNDILQRIDLFRKGQIVGNALTDPIPPLPEDIVGVIDGVTKCMERNQDGQILYSGICKEGIIFNGKTYVYDDAGTLISVRLWKNGRMMGEVEY